jgi:hypothetical protein
MPPFVSLRGMSIGTEPGFVGVAYRPFTPSGQAMAALKRSTANEGMAAGSVADHASCELWRGLRGLGKNPKRSER